jgi:hypothetical protein
VFPSGGGRLWRTGIRINRKRVYKKKLTTQQEEIALSQVLLHSFNALLQLQCRTLILQCGVPAQLAGVVGRLWLSYVAQWRETSNWGATHLNMVVKRYVPGLTEENSTRLTMSHKKSKHAQHIRAEFPEDDGSLRDAQKTSERSPRKRKSLDNADPAEDPTAADDELGSGRNTSDDDNAVEMEDAPGALDHAHAAVASAAFAAADMAHELSPTVPSASENDSRHSLQLDSGVLSLSLSLALLYLGCHILREPITMQQICVSVRGDALHGAIKQLECSFPFWFCLLLFDAAGSIWVAFLTSAQKAYHPSLPLALQARPGSAFSSILHPALPLADCSDWRTERRELLPDHGKKRHRRSTRPSNISPRTRRFYCTRQNNSE